MEENGNFATRCIDDIGVGNSTVLKNDAENNPVCPDQTEAFLTCKFVSQLTLLSGTAWGVLSDRYGKKVLTHSFALCNIVGLVLLIIGVRFPMPVVEDITLYGAFVLMGLASTVGGMLTVETGLLFSDQKQQNRVISLLNALFDAGAMAYLGLWGLEKLASSSFDSSANESSPNNGLILIIAGFLFMAVVCIGGYTYFFQIIQRKNSELHIAEENPVGSSDAGDEEEGNGDHLKTQNTTKTITLPPIDECDHPSPTPINNIVERFFKSSQSPKEECAPRKEEAAPTLHSTCHPYTPIAMRAPHDQMKSKAYILLGIWFSFHSTSNHWTLTTARDFLGTLGDDTYGNRYLGIFTLLTPFSIIALPFLDAVINKLGFYAALQAVNILGILHGIIKVGYPSLTIQVVGFVVFTFFRCFLYSVGLSCAASFIGPSSIGKATGTLYVLAGVTSFFNIGLAHWAIERESFFFPNLVYLVGTFPMIYLTHKLGEALEKDEESKLDHNCIGTSGATAGATTGTTTSSSCCK